MKNQLVYKLIFLTLLALLYGCEASIDDTGTPSPSAYSNHLTVGTGMNGFNLTGETSSFNMLISPLTVYWKLESSQDTTGLSMQLKVEKLVSGSYQDVSTTSPGTGNGHYMLSSISISQTAAYRLTGGIVSPNSTIASCLFTVN